MQALSIGRDTRLIAQGITGREGSFHTERMLKYGTRIVAGVTPGKGGQEVCGVPVFDSVGEAKKNFDADFSIIFVPAQFAKDAATEALSNGLDIVVITEGIPLHDTLAIIRLAEKTGRTVIGPNCPGVIVPGECKIGIMPEQYFKKGGVGVVSRSGTLTYEVVNQLSCRGVGQSIVLGVGGDPVVGTNFIQALSMLEADKKTEKIVLVGEIGGTLEEDAAGFIKQSVSKPVVAYVSGRFAPKEKRMGHAGAIISGSGGTAKSKIDSLRRAGVRIAELSSEIPKLLS